MPQRLSRLVTLLVIFFALVPRAHADSPVDGMSAAQRASIFAKGSVVRVLGYWEITFRVGKTEMREYVGGTGSGFFASADGFVVTNAHVIADIHAGEAKARYAALVQVLRKLDADRLNNADLGALMDILERSASVKKHAAIVMTDGTKVPYEVKVTGKPGEGTDVAVIKVDLRDVPNLPLADSTKVQVQDKVLAIGYPGAADMTGLLDDKSQLEATINEGGVSALKRTSNGDPIIQISASITHGNSGGPTINDKGEVIGLSTFGSRGEVQGFNFIVASATVNKFLAEAKVDTTPSTTTQHWRDGLDKLWANDPDGAIADFEEVLTQFPSHSEAPRLVQQARALKKERAAKDAERAKAAESGNAGGNAGGIAAAIVLVTLLGLGVVVLVRRAKRRHGAHASLPPAHAHKPVAKTIAITANAYGTLVCTRGQLAGQRFPLTPHGVLVGRQPGLAQIVIDDPRSSSKHVWVGYQNGHLVAIDQGTTNGTYVNDVRNGRIHTAPLRNGDTVIVGDPDCLSLTLHF